MKKHKVTQILPICGKKPFVRGLGAYSHIKKKQRDVLSWNISPRTKLYDIFERTLKEINEAKTKIEVLDALTNMDAELKAFKDEYYPGLSSIQRFEFEELIKEMVHKLEILAKRKLRMLFDEEPLPW